MNKEPTGGYVVNGKRYSFWPQLVQRKNAFIGGVLEDINDGPDCPVQTKIKDVLFEPNGPESAMFSVEGIDFGCSCDVRYLSVDPEISGDGWLGFRGYGGHQWRIRERDSK